MIMEAIGLESKQKWALLVGAGEDEANDGNDGVQQEANDAVAVATGDKLGHTAAVSVMNGLIF